MLLLSQEMDIPGCQFVLPDGPLPGARPSSLSYAWYDRLTHSRKDIEDSRDYLFAVMDYFSKGPNASSLSGPPQKPKPVILIGTSQGAVMSLEAGINYKGPVAAIVSMFGYIGNPKKTLAHPAAPPTTPILLVQGAYDPVVQVGDNEATMNALKKAGYHPITKILPIGHRISASTIQTVSRFIQQVLLKSSADPPRP
jgi:predicted esterase